jgi:predicted aspartyl protease
MKKLIILILFLFPLILKGQKINTKEIKVTFDNGFEIFNILTDKIDIIYREDLDYHWYNELSGHQSSTGASGGSLLHGKYSSFDEKGSLTLQGYYKFGLEDSIFTSWNKGLVCTKVIFKEGVLKYLWEKYESGRIFEQFSSDQYKSDYKVTLYSANGLLESETKCISFNPYVLETKNFYPNSRMLEEHYYCAEKNRFYGQYNQYFENGSIKCTGNYDKKFKLGQKIGLWLVYNEGSNKIDSLKYRLSETIINSEGEKIIGSLVYSSQINDWIRYGNWYKIDKNGLVLNEIELGIESDRSRGNNGSLQAGIIPESVSNTIKIIKTTTGLIEVPIILNDVLRINFIFDSGASEVSLSPDVALTLIRTGTITENDFLPDQTYTFADGSSAKSKRFLIRKLVIGNQTLTNIEASISKSIEAPMLIGQNVMQKIGSVTIDYANMLLIIKSK